MSASRSIVPIVSETDRSLFGLRGEDSHDDVGVIGFFVREGVVGVGGAGGSAFRSPARSYPETRGRIRGCAVVLGVARSYLRGALRYDRVELCTTACGRGTTARFYARPGGTAYDRAGPMAHGDEPVRAPGRSGLRRPASRRSAVRGCGACGMQQDSCRCAYPLAARGERPGLGSFGRGVPEPVAKESSAGIDGRGKPVIPTTSPVRFDWIRSPGHRAGGRLVGGGACGPGARGPHDRLVVVRGVVLLVEDRARGGGVGRQQTTEGRGVRPKVRPEGRVEGLDVRDAAVDGDLRDAVAGPAQVPGLPSQADARTAMDGAVNAKRGSPVAGGRG